MGTRVAELTVSLDSAQSAVPMSVCHFTMVHRELKSRSFHREFMPLAASGFRVRYVAPGQNSGWRNQVKFVAVPACKTRLSRFFAYPAFLRALLRENAKLYHFQDPELLPLAFVLKLVFRKRVVYDAYEDFPSMAANSRSIPRVLRPLAARIVATAESVAGRTFDGIMTADPLTLRRFARCGKNRKLVFYNFPNLAFFPEVRQETKQFDVVYRGGLSERAGTFLLLDALRLLSCRSVRPRLLLVGYYDDDAAKQALLLRIRTLGLASQIEIRGRLPHEEMSRAMGQARIGVSPLLPTRKFQINLPVKIFEYWACGLPVVASDLTPMRPFFRHGQAGLLFPPNNAEKLASSIGWLLDHPDSAAAMGRNGRRLVAGRLNNTFEIHKLRKFLARIGEAS